MMRWMKLIAIFLSTLTGALYLLPSQSVSASQAEPRTLIIYSSDAQAPDEYVYLVDQLISHFTETEIQADNEVGDVAPYDYLVYVGTSVAELDASLVKKIERFPNPVYFIGNNIHFFEERMKLQITEETVHIKSLSLPGGERKASFASFQYLHEVVAGEGIEPLLTGWRGAQEYPLLLSNGADYYLATTQMNELMSFYMTELLPDFFESPQTASPSSFMKIDNIDPTTNLDHLSELTTYTATKDIPLILSVQPIARVANTSKETYLSAAPDLVRKLLALQKLGSTFVYSYPLFPPNTPVEEKERIIEEEIQELVSYRIFPVAVSFPSGVEQLSEEDLTLAGAYFTTILSSAKPSSEKILKHATPYVAKPSYLNGMVWFPETLGAVERQNPVALVKMKQQLRQLESIPDAVVGFSLPVYTDLDVLKRVVDEVPNQRWVELKRWEHTVTVPYITIQSNEQGIVYVQNDLPFYRELLVKYHLSYVEMILWLLALIVLLFVVMFFIYTFYLNTQRRKALFLERKRHGQ
ncbi:hypothetical protein LC040_03030 [Bacillus tianshenii]|nr:hypothetical protein LC040_03030 [Bacillus tianshenii]